MNKIFEFDTKLPVNEALQKISSSLSQPKPFLEFGGEEFVGEVKKDNTFYIRKRFNRAALWPPFYWYNTFSRVLRGRVVSTSTGASITAEFKSFVATKVFMIFWIIACSSFAIVGLGIATTSQAMNDREGGLLVFVIAIIFVGFYFLVARIGKTFSKRDEDEIARLLVLLFGEPK